MSKGIYAKLRFCPQCGVESLVRDTYRQNVKEVVEFNCNTCGLGFRVGPSARVELANAMYADLRRERAGVEYKESSVGTQMADAFLRWRKTPEGRAAP